MYHVYHLSSGCWIASQAQPAFWKLVLKADKKIKENLRLNKVKTFNIFLNISIKTKNVHLMLVLEIGQPQNWSRSIQQSSNRWEEEQKEEEERLRCFGLNQYDGKIDWCMVFQFWTNSSSAFHYNQEALFFLLGSPACPDSILRIFTSVTTVHLLYSHQLHLLGSSVKY